MKYEVKMVGKSLRAQSARFHDSSLPLDFGRQAFQIIFARAPLRRLDRDAQRMESLADEGALDNFVSRLCETVHDRLGRALREFESRQRRAIEVVSFFRRSLQIRQYVRTAQAH